jgi:putative flavoprotein involved in K+ transport
VDDIVRARRVSSPQLIGSPHRSTLDLNALQTRGITLTGRLAGLRDGTLQFSGSLANHCALADLKMGRLLEGLDQYAESSGLTDSVEPAEHFAPTVVPDAPRLTLDLGSGEIRTVIWATGFRPDYRWLDVPVLDAKGRLRHEGGVVESPGMYAMGLSFMRRRKSSFIHGAADDARELAAHLKSYLDRTACGRGRSAA